MKAFTLTSLVFLSSFFVGCASTGQKSLLEERAGYGGAPPPSVSLSGSGSVKYVPTRVPETVIVPWLHGKELPSKDYFWGSWLSVRVKPETWEMKAVEVPAAAKPTVKRTQSKPQATPGSKGKP